MRWWTGWPSTRPAAAQRRRGGDGAVVEAEQRTSGAAAHGMLDGDRPRRRRSGASPATRRSPPEVHADAGRAGGDDLLDDEVGGEALADAAGVEAGPRRAGARASPSIAMSVQPVRRVLVPRAVIGPSVERAGRSRRAGRRRARSGRRRRRSDATPRRPARRAAGLGGDRDGGARLLRELVTSLAARKRLHRCSRSSMRSRAASTAPAGPPTTMTWSVDPIARNVVGRRPATCVDVSMPPWSRRFLRAGWGRPWSLRRSRWQPQAVADAADGVDERRVDRRRSCGAGS